MVWAMQSSGSHQVAFYLPPEDVQEAELVASVLQGCPPGSRTAEVGTSTLRAIFMAGVGDLREQLEHDGPSILAARLLRLEAILQARFPDEDLEQLIREASPVGAPPQERPEPRKRDRRRRK